jgi:hypothetical protein
MFLALVHLRELRCAQCGELLAAPGARSIVVDANRDPLLFDEATEPQALTAVIRCSRGHDVELRVPDQVSAEEVLTTPEDAPIGRDATVRLDVP